MSKQYIWNFFKSKLNNEYGVAGLMGNLQAESGLHCDRVQGDIPYSNYSKEYTAKVDSGEISEHDFVYNGVGGGGYGLAQWTFWSRKQALYNMYKSGGYSSIGSVELACDFLWSELQSTYAPVLNVLKNATSIREASDKVLHDFENPADQSTSVEELRANLGQAIYNELSGSGGGDIPDTPDPPIDPDDPDDPKPSTQKKHKFKFVIFSTAKKRRKPQYAETRFSKLHNKNRVLRK